MEYSESFEKILNALCEKYPEASVELHKFLSLHMTLKNVTFEPFIEPDSSFEVTFQKFMDSQIRESWVN